MNKFRNTVLTLIGLVCLTIGCKDESLNPYIEPQGNAHGFGQFVSQFDNTTLLPPFGNNQFYDQTAVDRVIFFDDAVTTPNQLVNFKLQWQSIDNKVKIETIELYLEYDEVYSDAGRNPKTAKHGGVSPNPNPSYPPGKFWKSIPAGDQLVSQDIPISADDVYEVFKDNTFDYGSGPVNIFTGHPYNAFSQVSNGYSFDRSTANTRFKRQRVYTLPSGNVTLAADVFRIHWRLITADGTAYGTWNPSVCSSVVGATCFGQWRVARDLFLPTIAFSQRGQWGALVNGVRQRPVINLRNGARDTINVVFNREIAAANPPTAALSTATATWATLGTPVAYDNKDNIANNSWYVPIQATAAATGAARLQITGAVSAVGSYPQATGVGVNTRDFQVDNTAPQASSRSWSPTRIGRGQSTTLTVNFNEPVSLATADSIHVLISGQNVDPMPFPRRLTLAANGLSGTFIYFYKDSDNPTDATTGDLTIVYGGGKDVAGNALDLTTITAGGLRTDVSGLDPVSLTPIVGMSPPNAPSLTLPTDYDQKTSLKWSFGVTTPVSSSNAGTLFYIILANGTTLPTTFQRTLDVAGIKTWNGYNTAGIASSAIIAQGSIPLSALTATTGGTGTVFTAFTPNGTYDVYAYWVSSTGNVSPVSSALGPIVTTP